MMMMEMGSKSETAPASASPCAACKMQRKKCGDKCILAPYFPQDTPQKFLLVHRVYGTGNFTKLLQEVPVEQRGEAVSSMVWEAGERLKDPVNGSAGQIHYLQRKLMELQSQLNNTQQELGSLRLEHSNLIAILTGFNVNDPPSPQFFETETYDIDFPYDAEVELWEPIWE